MRNLLFLRFLTVLESSCLDLSQVLRSVYLITFNIYQFFACNSHVTVLHFPDQSLENYVTVIDTFWLLQLPDLINSILQNDDWFRNNALKRPKFRHWYRFQSLKDQSGLFLAVSDNILLHRFLRFFKCTYKEKNSKPDMLFLFTLWLFVLFIFFLFRLCSFSSGCFF